MTRRHFTLEVLDASHRRHGRLEASALGTVPPASVALAPTRQNQAMMIVGGAGLIVGAIIGGDAGTIFMVGGAVIGLYGLWDYLR